MKADESEDRPERLQKALAGAGIASRRACEELIRQGRVAVNGRLVRELGTKVVPSDVITVDGKPVQSKQSIVYIIVNKPVGYVTTVADELGRPTALDLVPRIERIFPVGRLDADSEGLLLLTNDGDLAYKLTHPRFGFEKEYNVLVDGNLTEAELRTLREGVVLDGRKTAPALVERMSMRAETGHTWLRFVIHEGRKRQIRRMLAHIGFVVIKLIRVRLGPIRLGNLPSGQHRHLKPEEVEKLRANGKRVARRSD